MPVGVYFRKFLDQEIAQAGESLGDGGAMSADTISEIMKDYKGGKIKIFLKKIWQNEFYKYCRDNLPQETADIMSDLLMFESDCTTI